MRIIMKILSPEHRKNLSKAAKQNWAYKHIKNPPHGEANRMDVVNAVRTFVCNTCEPDIKSECNSLAREQVRQGRLIQCLQKIQKEQNDMGF